jgi:hypothetical protein
MLKCSITNQSILNTKHIENLEKWCPHVLIPLKVIKRKIQLIPFKVFKNLILSWAKTDMQIVKKVITLCENL